MTPEMVLTQGKTAIQLGLMVSLPLLLTALAVGIVVGIVQGATQIQETALPFVIKLFAMAAVFVMTGPWMLRMLMEFTQTLLRDIPQMIR